MLSNILGYAIVLWGCTLSVLALIFPELRDRLQTDPLIYIAIGMILINMKKEDS